MRVLCFDPSGNWSKNEGKGSSGWALFEDGELKTFGDLEADNYSSLEDYWYQHVDLIDNLSAETVVIESYKLQPGKAMQQSWSAMETSQLIGFMRMHCWYANIPVVFQDPAIKVRVADIILVKEGVFERKGGKHYCMGRPTNLHARDAVRHGVYYHKYGKG